jgi:phosphohistidine phosphatase
VKRVFVLRHAKSSWSDDTLADHDRPLADRGRRAVGAMCEHLRAQGVAPDIVLCSTAVRTRETLALIERAFQRPEIRFEEALYGASAKLASKFPTAALATLELPIDGWDALGHDTADLAGFVRPRDL